MSQLLLPLANLASEIMNEWKGRIRAVTVIDYSKLSDEKDVEENKEDEKEGSDEEGGVRVILGWQDVPFMRELLRRLKSILRRKPECDESTSIRPLLLDLQGVPRFKQNEIDSSIEMPFYPPPSASDVTTDQWYYLEQFLAQIRRLMELVSLSGVPFLVEERMTGGSDKNSLLSLVEECKKVWDEELFRAQFMDWYDMVKIQHELNLGRATDQTNTLSKLSEKIREAEIELSIAMASKDQLERVLKRLEALRADKMARYKVLAHITFDVGYRELNDGIVVEPPSEDDITVELPSLSSVPSVFGNQLALSGEL